MEESDEEWTPNPKANYFIKNSKKNVAQKTPSQLPSQNILFGSSNTNSIRDNINSEYLFNFSKKFLRLEYPGLVKNVSAAIETLGGIGGIELAASDHRIKLELNFHPKNKYNKPCSADRDCNPGILIKIKNNTSSSQNNSEKEGAPKCYDVIGVTSQTFKFNRLCDFQYLPVVPSNVTDKEVEYVYDKICPEKLPTLEWFLSKETSTQPKFFTPPSFARFDTAQNKLYLNSGERFDTNLRPELLKSFESNKSAKKSKVSTRQISIFVNLQIPNVQIPDQPLACTMKLIKERKLEGYYKAVKKLFDERPVWTKVAIQHKTGINVENAKVVLPAVAYFCPLGPWRMTWIKYEYNPQKDFNARIYQTLDYRIRAKEGTKLKVVAKRSYSNKNFKDLDNSSSNSVDERSYVLKPNFIPPARQMFYQYCDIMLPEIQEMVSRLPKLPAGAKFDPKNGWLPVNFTEQCREIVNKYVMDRVQEELLEDTIKMQQQQLEESEREETADNSPTYCSKMLSNIKKGIYKTGNPLDIARQRSQSETNLTDSEVHTIDLLDEDDLEQINADDVVSSIPERMKDNSDDEHLSESSDLEIDMEAVEDVNNIIAGIHEEDEVTVMTSFLKENL